MLKNILGPEGPPEGAQGGAMAPVAPLGYATVDDTDANFTDMSVSYWL